MYTWDAEFPEGANLIRQLYSVIVIKATRSWSHVVCSIEPVWWTFVWNDP